MKSRILLAFGTLLSLILVSGTALAHDGSEHHAMPSPSPTAPAQSTPSPRPTTEPTSSPRPSPRPTAEPTPDPEPNDCVTAAPFGSAPCPGTRPGAIVQIPTAAPEGLQKIKGGCTLGFMYRGSDGHRYITTAGHCAGIGEQEERTWVPGDGIAVFDNSFTRIGEILYAIQDLPPGDEFAPDMDISFIRLDDDVDANPRLCHFGGPTALHPGGLDDDVQLIHYFGVTPFGGYFGYDQDDVWLVPARSGVTTGLPDEKRTYFYGHASFGDSGAPIIDHFGRALASLASVGDARPDGYAGLVAATRLGPQIAKAEAALGIDLELITASL